MCLGCSEHTKATRSHLIKYSGIEAAIMDYVETWMDTNAKKCRGVGGNKRRNGQAMEDMSWAEAGN